MSSPVEDQLIYVEIRENVFFIIWKTSSNINSATSAQPLTSLLPSKCNWQWSCIFITGHNIFYALDCVWPTNFVFLHVADVSCKICRPWCSSLRDTLSGSDLVLLHHLLSNNPHWLHYESAMAQYGWQLASQDRGVPVIITLLIGMCYKNNNTKCSRLKEWQKSMCLSLFFEICVFWHFECFTLKSNRMSYCCFGARLPICLVLNSAEFLPCAPANRSPVLLCQRASDCRSWDRADKQRTW